MNIELYQIDAFANQLFSGNPAAVCPLTEFLPDETMQAIANENNLSETAFFVKDKDEYHIRWFTPAHEVKLCGHATLATAFVVFNYFEKDTNNICFHSKSGPLYVKKLDNDSIQLDFPAIHVEKIDFLPTLVDALGVTPKAMYQTHQDYLVVFDNEEQILSIQPDFSQLLKLDLRGVIISSPSNNKFDFVSRFFAPKVDVYEDPVTGSAHCILTPYWADKLSKNKLKAKQLSQRGGELQCELLGDRVLLSGQTKLYMQGSLFI